MTQPPRRKQFCVVGWNDKLTEWRSTIGKFKSITEKAVGKIKIYHKNLFCWTRERANQSGAKYKNMIFINLVSPKAAAKLKLSMNT